MAAPPALTTLFTPPASCLSQIYREDPGPNYVLGNPLDTANCLPDGFNYAQTPYFSPALQCPVGYTKACGSTNAIGGLTETIATCCPSGGFQCRSLIQNPWDSTYSCSLLFPSDTVVTVTSSTSGTAFATTVSLKGGFDGMNAFSVQIRWQSTDLLPSSTSSSSSSSTASATTSLRTTSANPSASHAVTTLMIFSGTSPSALTVFVAGAATSPAPSPGISTNNGLSQGAKIGIGLGVPFGALLSIIAGALLWRRKKTAAPDSAGMSGYPELHGQPTYVGTHKISGHFASNEPAELRDTGRPAEMGG